MPESTGEGSCSQHRENVVVFVVQVCLLDFECEKIGITKRNGGIGYGINELLGVIIMIALIFWMCVK